MLSKTKSSSILFNEMSQVFVIIKNSVKKIEIEETSSNWRSTSLKETGYKVEKT